MSGLNSAHSAFKKPPVAKMGHFTGWNPRKREAPAPFCMAVPDLRFVDRGVHALGELADGTRVFATVAPATI